MENFACIEFKLTISSNSQIVKATREKFLHRFTESNVEKYSINI